MEKLKKLLTVFLVSGLFISFYSCSPDENDPDLDSEDAQVEQSTDVNNANDASDEAVEDAAQGMSESGFGRFNQVPCNASIGDTTKIANKTIIITYDGENCRGDRTRTGKIEVKFIPAPGTQGRWQDAGAKLEITFIDYKVTRKADSKSVTLNGKKTITNTSGGNYFNYPTGGLKLKVRGNLALKFDNDETTRSWWVARMKTWNDGKITISGDSTNSNVSSMAEGGINRRGKTFYTTISEDVEFQSCSLTSIAFKPVKGQIVHHVETNTLTVNFGFMLDAGSLPVEVNSCTTTGIYIEWTSSNNSGTKFIQF